MNNVDWSFSSRKVPKVTKNYLIRLTLTEEELAAARLDYEYVRLEKFKGPNPAKTTFVQITNSEFARLNEYLVGQGKQPKPADRADHQPTEEYAEMREIISVQQDARRAKKIEKKKAEAKTLNG